MFNGLVANSSKPENPTPLGCEQVEYQTRVTHFATQACLNNYLRRTMNLIVR